MIEVTINNADGVNFVGKIKILKPDDTIGGIGIHYVVPETDGEFIRALRLIGMRKVGHKPELRCDMYASSILPYIAIRVVQTGLTMYWWLIRWLYNNACVFRRIPLNEQFSWKHFTPYIWATNFSHYFKRKIGGWA